MFFKQLIQCVKSCVTKVIQQVEKRLKQWTKPRTESLIVGTLADVIRGKAELIAENALLRQQVIILQRQVKRPLAVENRLWGAKRILGELKNSVFM